MAHGAERRAVFLDRDGTINVEVNYLRRMGDVQLLPGVAEALAALRQHGFLLVGITNQGGIARGLLDAPMLDAIHERLQSLLGQGARLDAIYHCPHHPLFTGACACRKPLPGMLLQAAKDHRIDLAHSWMVGDTLADVAAGRAAGCSSILVRTGYGSTQAALASDDPVTVVDDIMAAAALIMNDTLHGDR